MGKTNIGWVRDPKGIQVGVTWNPVTACSHVSEGCRYCYAESLSRRRGWTKLPWTAANAPENVQLHSDRLDYPLRWRKPHVVFVNSMSDLFHDLVSDAFLDQVFAVMAATPQHTYQILTKRPLRMRAYLTQNYIRLMERWSRAASVLHAQYGGPRWPLPNVWLGVSVEDQAAADNRIPYLLLTLATLHFVSCEPLLGPLDIASYLDGAWSNDNADPNPNVANLDWVIVGGESGPHHRPLDLAWVRDLRDQCTGYGSAAFFYKQNSHRYPGQDRVLDGRTWDEIPGGPS